MMPIYAICPFFQTETGNRVYCEARTFKFKNHKYKRTLTANFCENFNYENCKHAQDLMKKYENQKGDENDR